jgi:hypothetical protein
MNDTELDRLLDAWEAPAPSTAMRAGVRDRFPRAERRRFGRSLRWALVAVVATATLAVGMQQGDTSAWDAVFQPIRHYVMRFVGATQIRHSEVLMQQVRSADPQVYVDGQLQGPADFTHASMIRLDIPGDGAYRVSLHPSWFLGWPVTGRLQGNTMEFRAGSKQVRIVCNQSFDGQWPVSVQRAPGQ